MYENKKYTKIGIGKFGVGEIGSRENVNRRN